jgi:CheY-like chemotaxis protein/HPt (histidine-containing phosphotransfer) domain-containing protein
MANEDNKLKILVVDDSDIIRHSLKNFFQDYNFEVITCLNGLEGIQMAIAHKPSLIFLDLMMPNFDGVKMLQVIKVLDNIKNIPVIVISGNTDKRNVLAALEAGAEKVVSKPLQKEILIKNINEVLGSDFLKKAKRGDVFNDGDNKEIKKQLVTFFLQGFPYKRSAMMDSINNKNTDLMKTVIHEIKGTGGTIGYPQLTLISEDIEKKLALPSVDWQYIKIKCDQIFSVVNEIQSRNTLVEN